MDRPLPAQARISLPFGAAARPRALLVGAAFTALYVAGDWVSYIHPMQQSGITPWNPQPAFAIALLMLGGQRWLPLVFAAALLAEWAVRHAAGGWSSAVLVAAVLSLGYAAIAHALTHRFAVSPALATRRDVLRLVAVVAVGALGTGALFVGSLLASRIGPMDEPFTALVRFWIGDSVGILVTLPFLLMACVPARRAEMRRMLGGREAALHAAATAAALAAVFTSPAGEQVKLFYVLFLPLILVAVRNGLVGAAIATLLIQAAVIVSGELAGYQALTIFEFQSLLIALTVTGLFLGVTVDERRSAEHELRASLRMAAAGEMASALAHELNQPLTAVAGYARASRLMARPGADAALLPETLDKLVAETHRAAEVVRRLRDFFRTGATRLALTSLGEVAAAAVESQRGAAAARAVALELDAAAALEPLRIDATQLEVVMRNLLANAIEAAAGAPPPARVRLELREAAPGGITVRVTDSGPGVRAADAERIFEPFMTTRASGMGMGLAISRAIVEAHGGRLWAEPGPSGAFCFTLPGGAVGDA